MDKRKFWIWALVIAAATALLVLGYITSDQWMAVVTGAKAG